MATMASRPNTVFTNYDVACSLIGPGRERITQVQRILESLEDSACHCSTSGARVHRFQTESLLASLNAVSLPISLP
jgi:hypothetical protein